MSNHRPAVLVFGTRRRESLFIMRSLHASGHEVIAISEGHATYTHRSRLCDGSLATPLREDATAFIARLHQFVEEHPHVEWIFPVGDDEIQFLDRHRAALPPGLKCVMPAPETIDACQNKARLLRDLEELGIATGRHTIVKSGGNLADAIEKVGVPCVVKPNDDTVTLAGQKAVILSSAEEAKAFVSAYDPAIPVVVQSYLEGPRHNVYFAADRGALVRAVQVEILRTDRPDGTGYAVDGRSIPLSETLEREVRLLAEFLKYHGCGCMQFIVAPQGETVFLEINSRVGANSAITAACGFDSPVVYVALQSGENVRRLARFTYPQKRYAWMFGDLHGLAAALRDGTVGLLGALAWLSAMTKTLLRANVHIVFRWDDPLPALTLLVQKLTSPFVRLNGSPHHVEETLAVSDAQPASSSAIVAVS